MRSQAEYDVIIIDSFGQTVNQEFYTADIYREAMAALKSSGLFYVKIPTALVSPEGIDVILRTAEHAIEDPWLVRLGGGEMVGMLGMAPDTLPIKPTPMPGPKRVGPMPWEDLLASSEVIRLDKPVMDRIGGTRLNTDDRPYFFPIHKINQDPEPGTEGKAVRQHLDILFDLGTPL